jgi:hypothetical protein
MLPPVVSSTPPTEVATQEEGLARSADGSSVAVFACLRRRLAGSVLEIYGKLYIGRVGLAKDVHTM